MSINWYLDLSGIKNHTHWKLNEQIIEFIDFWITMRNLRIRNNRQTSHSCTKVGAMASEFTIDMLTTKQPIDPKWWYSTSIPLDMYSDSTKFISLQILVVSTSISLQNLTFIYSGMWLWLIEECRSEIYTQNFATQCLHDEQI